MNRRHFIASTALAGAATGVISSGAAAAVSESMHLVEFLMITLRPSCCFLGFTVALVFTTQSPAATPALAPTVEIEEDVYSYTSANNGAGPMWCHGSTCLVRDGDHLFASGLETIPNAKPLNNCRPMLFRRGVSAWEKVWVDPTGRTREPSPLAVFPTARQIFLSTNPTADPNAYAGPAHPEIIEFAAPDPASPVKTQTIRPVWQGQPPFSEHSYRSFAADRPARELILFQNIGYTHAEWAFLDRTGHWSAQGQLKWPWGADYAKPQPIRVCYPNVALQNRAVHFCGVSDILEPNPEWRAYKKQITGRDWDYDFRRLFYTWCPDIRSGKFQPWLEVASREKNGGWIMPGDLWVALDGTVHLLWTERAIDERLREKFFPAEKQRHSLEYAVLRDGKITLRKALIAADEGLSHEVPGRARFHVTGDNRLFVFCHVSGSRKDGKSINENRLIELGNEGCIAAQAKVHLKKPFTEFFTATPRAGSPPSPVLDVLGPQAGSGSTISYARIKLF